MQAAEIASDQPQVSLGSKSVYEPKPAAARSLLGWEMLLLAVWLGAGVLWILILPLEARLDMDEGINLMKARLVSAGFALYRDIWSDQPPLFTYFLSIWWKIAGDSADSSRILVMIFGTLALLASGRLSAWLSGKPMAGLLAIGLIMGSRHFARLSGSVMIGLPAISLALLGAWLVVASAGRRWSLPGMFFAGCLVAASLQTKFFTFMLLPMIVFLMIIAHNRRNVSRGWRMVEFASLLAGFASLFIPLLPMGVDNWQQQLVSPHVRQNRPEDEARLQTAIAVVGRVFEDPHLLVLAVFAMLCARREGRVLAIAPVVWFGVSAVALSQANPLWGHHRLMLTMPLCMIAAVALPHLSTHGPHRVAVLRFASITLAVALVLGLARFVKNTAQSGRSEIEQTREMLGAITSRSQPGEWIVSDDPFFAFQSHLQVPPNIAVSTKKRLTAMQLTDTELLETTRKYQPRLLLFARFPVSKEFQRGIASEYRLVLEQTDGSRLYERLP